MDWLARKRVDFLFVQVDIYHKSTLRMEAAMAKAYNSNGHARTPFEVLPDLSADPVAMVDRLVVAATNSLKLASLNL